MYVAMFKWCENIANYQKAQVNLKLAVVILTAIGKPLLWQATPHATAEKTIGNDGNSEHIVSCHMAKSSGTFT